MSVVKSSRGKVAAFLAVKFAQRAGAGKAAFRLAARGRSLYDPAADDCSALHVLTRHMLVSRYQRAGAPKYGLRGASTRQLAG
jgi:hypothetical protein